MIGKKNYTKPEIKRVVIDNSISLVMMTSIPPNPTPRGDKKGSDPFSSPFDDKPFGG